MDPLTWAAIGMLVASLAISVATASKAQKPKQSGISDMNIPQVDEGTAQAGFFGDCWTGDWMVLWVGNLRTSKIKSSSGKGFSKYKKLVKKMVVISMGMNGYIPGYGEFIKGKLNR